MLMHGATAALVGKDMSDTKDPNGKRFIAEMVDLVRQKSAGFVDYTWAKPGSEKPQPKLSYVVRLRAVGLGDLDRRLYRRSRRADLGVDPALADRGRPGAADLARGLGVHGQPHHRPAQPDHRSHEGTRRRQARRRRCRASAAATKSARWPRRSRCSRPMRWNVSASKPSRPRRKPAPPRSARRTATGSPTISKRAVGEIIETVSSASTELEASASTLTVDRRALAAARRRRSPRPRKKPPPTCSRWRRRPRR